MSAYPKILSVSDALRPPNECGQTEIVLIANLISTERAAREVIPFKKERKLRGCSWKIPLLYGSRSLTKLEIEIIDMK